MTGLLVTAVEVGRRRDVDVRIAGDRVTEVGVRLARRRGEDVLDGGGGALLPGLHDHHVHLLALAAAGASVVCGPPAVTDEAGLAAALRAAPGDWVRGVGYHASVAGDLDRHRLDRLAGDRPVRVQHRSGALWSVNSAAARRLGLDGGGPLPPGVELDAGGAPTGRLFGLDGWLRERLGPGPPPDLERVGRALARRGVTGVTDATAANDVAELSLLQEAVERGALPQRLVVMGRPGLARHAAAGAAPVRVSAVKLVPAEDRLPPLDELADAVRGAHAEGRPVAIHCVTHAGLLLALAALEDAGPAPGDRIEHASVAPPAATSWMARLGVTVVTQPNFVAERGDEYALEVDAADRPWLYRVRGLLEAGVAVGGGTDAPFGEPDPWAAMRAAVRRTTPSGRVLGPGEAVSPERARRLFTTPPARPGGRPRRVVPGAVADLCLLRVGWRDARDALSSDLVAATVCRGHVVWAR